MLRINSINLKNLRSLRDTGDIKIKPITILVGKNSVGKSTFLRTFPLLKQSCEKETRGPILWYGNLVDYGDFSTSINRNAAENEQSNYIEFSFGLDIDQDIHHFLDISLNQNIDAKMTLQMKEHNKSSYASRLKLSLFDKNIIVDLNANQDFEKISIDGKDFTKDYFKERGLTYRVGQGKYLPFFILLKPFKIKDKKAEFTRHAAFFEEMLLNVIKDLCRNNVKNDTIELLIKNIPFSSSIEIHDYLSNQDIISGLAKKIKKMDLKSTQFREVVDFYYLYVYESLIPIIDENLAAIFSRVRYLEPLRATAQRYYRRQELAINEIDSKGSNIAMFLDSLSQAEKNSLTSLLMESFNIELNVRRESGHLALTIKTPALKEETNIADLGVGYSQILPFIIQLWDCNDKKRINRSNNFPFFGRGSGDYFIVEQPELHLHPAYQAKIADVIEKIIDKEKLSLIIETHSPHLIYRFGELVEDKESRIDKEDIQILIFEENDGETHIRQAAFDDDGRLLNWPIGFFHP